MIGRVNSRLYLDRERTLASSRSRNVITKNEQTDTSSASMSFSMRRAEARRATTYKGMIRGLAAQSAEKTDQ